MLCLRYENARLQLRTEMSAICTANTPCGQNVQVLNDESGGIVSYEWHQSLAIVTRHTLAPSRQHTAFPSNDSTRLSDPLLPLLIMHARIPITVVHAAVTQNHRMLDENHSAKYSRRVTARSWTQPPWHRAAEGKVRQMMLLGRLNFRNELRTLHLRITVATSPVTERGLCFVSQ